MISFVEQALACPNRTLQKRRGPQSFPLAWVRRRNMPSIDRLSAFPDSIISHILSLLPTKNTVATSILARRWSSLWAQVPALHFDGENRDIINRVMLLHQVPSIESFRLRLSLYDDHGCSEHHLETWIIAAIARNVKKLDLRFRYNKVLPRCLFTCETLVDLGLNCCGVIPVNPAVCFPRLKKLRLSSVRYEADDSLPNLLSGCPVLDDLVIEFIHGKFDLVCCNVSSPHSDKSHGLFWGNWLRI